MMQRSTFLSLFLLTLGQAAPALAQTKPSARADEQGTETSTSNIEDRDAVESLDDPSSKPGQETPPWWVGVSEQDAAIARQLFQEGNALVRESVFVPAIDKYEESIKHWDHPGIHYNLSLALLNLEQPLRLRYHLVQALKYDGQPLGQEKKLRAKQYLNLVEKQLSHLVVSCEHKQATVKLDDKLVGKAPMKLDQYLIPGRHRVVATAPGFVTKEEDLSLLPGDTKTLNLKLYTEEEWTKYKRKWSPVGPIVVTISGVVVAGTGGLLFWLGDQKVKKEEQRIEDECPSGCTDEDTEVSQAGETMQKIGFVTMITGGAATIVGGVLLYVNRKIPYREEPTAHGMSFTPVVSPYFSGLLGQGTF